MPGILPKQPQVVSGHIFSRRVVVDTIPAGVRPVIDLVDFVILLISHETPEYPEHLASSSAI